MSTKFDNVYLLVHKKCFKHTYIVLFRVQCYIFNIVSYTNLLHIIYEITVNIFKLQKIIIKIFHSFL